MFDVKFYGSATVGTKGQVVIPAEARAELKIREGDKMVVIRQPHGGGVVMLKAEKLEEILGALQSNIGLVTKSFDEAKKEKK